MRLWVFLGAGLPATTYSYFIGEAVGILAMRRTHEEAELVYYDADNRPVL